MANEADSGDNMRRELESTTKWVDCGRLRGLVAADVVGVRQRLRKEHEIEEDDGFDIETGHWHIRPPRIDADGGPWLARRRTRATVYRGRRNHGNRWK